MLATKTRLYPTFRLVHGLAVLSIALLQCTAEARQRNDFAILTRQSVSHPLGLSGPSHIDAPHLIGPSILVQWMDDGIIDLPKQQMEALKQACDSLVFAHRTLGEFPNDTVLHDEVVRRGNAMTELAEQVLAEKQKHRFQAQLQYFRVRAGFLRRESVPLISRFLREKEFWNRIESPSRSARRRAVKQILDVLNDEQRKHLHEYLPEDVIYAVHQRNDVVHQQLLFPHRAAARESSLAKSPFGDLRWVGDYALYSNGDLQFYYFGSEIGEVPLAVQVRVLMDPTILKAIDLDPNAVRKIQEWMTEYQKKERERTMDRIQAFGDVAAMSPEQLIELSDHRDSPELRKMRESIEHQIQSLLMPHQFELLRHEFSKTMTAFLGMRWALTYGELANHLDVTPDQKQAIMSASKLAAEELKATSDKLESLAIGMMCEAMPNQFSKNLLARTIPDSSCGYPCLPVSGLIYQDDIASAYQLRLKFGFDESEPKR